jgi:hypothetical protein
MSQAVAQQKFGSSLVGRPFVNSLFDYLLIGGGLSLIVTGFLLLNPQYQSLRNGTLLPYVILLSNSCHFAASTVRLYTKPGATKALPFLSMTFPLVMFAVLTAGIIYANDVGSLLRTIYLTWSPFHYAAQAYGLAVMYSYRSGCLLEKNDKRLLWWVSMLPFLHSLLYSERMGVHWLMPGTWSSVESHAGAALNALDYVFYTLAFAAPVLLSLKIRAGKSGTMPLISLLPIVSNGVWFFVLDPRDAFTWATIFHGIQYLAIVIVFHVKDQMAQPTNRHSVLYHVVWFYFACLVLGYAIFHCVPYAYVWAGFGYVESIYLVSAVINIHHFIVDAYIWRLKKTDGNRRIVDAAVPAPEAAAAV